MNTYFTVHLDNVTFGFPGRPPLFKGINLSLKPKGFCYLTGKSGSGKSTLIKLISGLLPIHSGILRLFGRDIDCQNPMDIVRMRQEIGLVFQDSLLFHHLTLAQNVAIPLRIRGYTWRESLGIALEALDCVNLKSLENAYPNEISGGEQQRAAVARAIVTRPKLLLSDEATGNLDPENSARLMHLFLNLNQQGTAVIFATHNRELIRKFPQNEWYIQDGCLHEIPLQSKRQETNHVTSFA